MKKFNLNLFAILTLLFVTVFSCNTVDDEIPGIKLKEISDQNNDLKLWYESTLKNQPSPTIEENKRLDKKLRFKDNEINIDWSSQEKYNLLDGRSVYELNFQSDKPIFPSEFLHRSESDRGNYFSEKILFIKNHESDYEIILARFYTLDDKQNEILKNATYQSIPKNWTGRIDVFSYRETHLKSYVYKEGILKSTIEYSKENETGKINNTNKLVVCSGAWVNLPYWWGTIESYYEVRCQIVPESGGFVSPPYNNLGQPYYPHTSYGGGFVPQGGGGTGNPGTGCTPTDNTNNFQDPNNCIPPPNWEDPEVRRTQQLNYLRTHGASEFATLIDQMLAIPGIKVGDVWEINLIVNQVFERQVGLFMMAIFSPENISLFLGNLFANPTLTNNVRNKSFQYFSTYGNSIAQPIYSSLTSGNFRYNLIQRTGFNPGTTAQAHHVFPQTTEFSAFFASKGLNVHNPTFGAWWPSSTHQLNSAAYNQIWRQWITANPGATYIEVLEFGRQTMAYFKIAILF